jgi:hypothetical protein
MINIPVSAGELIDKISILQVKETNIKNPEKLALVKNELTHLNKVAEIYLADERIEDLLQKLVHTNGELWKVEDELRVMESKGLFNDDFIHLARDVYHLNDQRFEWKNEINSITRSEIREVKEYINYK